MKVVLFAICFGIGLFGVFLFFGYDSVDLNAKPFSDVKQETPAIIPEQSTTTDCLIFVKDIGLVYLKGVESKRCTSVVVRPIEKKHK